MTYGKATMSILGSFIGNSITYGPGVIFVRLWGWSPRRPSDGTLKINANLARFTSHPEGMASISRRLVYAWFVWDSSAKNDPIIKWIDNNDFILSKKDK